MLKTEVMKFDAASAGREETGHIVGVMRKGGVVVFPTDTYYGLGGDGLCDGVIRRVYALKRREASKPLLVLISGTDMVKELAADIPSIFWRVAEKFWPGPLSVVLKASPRVPAELGAGTATVAMRLPGVPWLRELVREAGFPVIATSANISGEGEISDGEAARGVFEGKADLVVDGGRTPGGSPSTVLDLSSPEPRILREGAVPAAALRDVLGI